MIVMLSPREPLSTTTRNVEDIICHSHRHFLPFNAIKQQECLSSPVNFSCSFILSHQRRLYAQLIIKRGMKRRRTMTGVCTLLFFSFKQLMMHTKGKANMQHAINEFIFTLQNILLLSHLNCHFLDSNDKPFLEPDIRGIDILENQLSLR